jgi:hypothetical protein
MSAVAHVFAGSLLRALAAAEHSAPAAAGRGPRYDRGEDRMKLRALVLDPESIERFLRHQGLWSPPPEPRPTSAP